MSIVVWNVKQAYILMSLEEVCEKAWRPSSKVAWNEKCIEFWCLSSFHYKCEDELPRKGRENDLDLLHFHRKIEVKKFSCAFKTWEEQNHPKERREENTFKTIPDDKLILWCLI